MLIEKLQTESIDASMNKRLTESQNLAIGHEQSQTVINDGKLTKFHRNLSHFEAFINLSKSITSLERFDSL